MRLLHPEQMANWRIPKAWEFVEGEKELTPVEQKPKPVLRHVGDLNFGSAFSKQCGFFLVPPDDIESRAKSLVGEAIVLRQLDFRFKLRLCLSFSMMHMHVKTEFLPGDEEKPKAFHPEDGRTHEDMIHQPQSLGGERPGVI